MHRVLVFFFLNVFIFKIGQSQALILTNLNESDITHLGEVITLNLELDFDKSVQRLKGDSIVTVNTSGFKKNIIVQLNKVGKQQLGPYEIKLGKKKIRSNFIEITVLEKKDEPINEQRVELFITDTCYVGKEIQLLIESNFDFTKSNMIKKLNDDMNITDLMLLNKSQFRIVENDFFKVINIEFQKSYNSTNNVEIENVRYVINLLPIKEGVYTFNKNTFYPAFDINVNERNIVIIK